MELNTTSGEEYSAPDMCAHCTTDTGGGHDSHCPLFRPHVEEVVNTIHIGQVVQIRMKTRISWVRAMWADICGKCGAHRLICPHED